MFCCFFKLLISHNLDNKTKNSRFVEKHIASCKSCCQFYNYAKVLEDKLPQDARILQSDSFLNTVNTKKFNHVTIRHITKIKPALLALAACITIAVIFSAVLSIQKSAETKKLKQAKSQETLKYVLSAHNLITGSIQGQESSSKLAQAMANPYKNEINSIKSETKTALRFLVSCVEIHIDNNQKDTIIN